MFWWILVSIRVKNFSFLFTWGRSSIPWRVILTSKSQQFLFLNKWKAVQRERRSSLDLTFEYTLQLWWTLATSLAKQFLNLFLRSFESHACGSCHLFAYFSRWNLDFRCWLHGYYQTATFLWAPNGLHALLLVANCMCGVDIANILKHCSKVCLVHCVFLQTSTNVHREVTSAPFFHPAPTWTAVTIVCAVQVTRRRRIICAQVGLEQLLSLGSCSQTFYLRHHIG